MNIGDVAPYNLNDRIKIVEEAAIEDFEDGSLIFLCFQRRMIDVNPTARRILSALDGKRNLGTIIVKISRDFEIPIKDISKDVRRLLTDLIKQGVVQCTDHRTQKRRLKMGGAFFLSVNPSVSIREEKDGGLLFNADTGALLAINGIGLASLKFMKEHPRTRTAVVDHIMEIYDAASSDKAEADLDQFLAELKEKEFIKEVRFPTKNKMK